MRAAHTKAVECYRDGVTHARPPGERVVIPFDGKTMYGVLRKPAGLKPPVLIMAPGLDSTKEEIHAYEEPFLARGIAVLAIDGPGQGEAEYEIPICGDYERAAKAVCDWIEKRADLDAAKTAIWGSEPRRVLRTARGRIRKAHQSLHRPFGSLRLGTDLGRPAGTHARNIPGAQPFFGPE